MSDFFDMPLEEIESLEPMYFTASVPVQMTILSIKELPAYKSMILTCEVHDGEHAGKHFDMRIDGGDQPTTRRKKAAFLLAFWTKEELKTGTATLDTLIGTKFQCRPERPYTSEKSGKTYQSFIEFLKLETSPIDPNALPF